MDTAFREEYSGWPAVLDAVAQALSVAAAATSSAVRTAPAASAWTASRGQL